MRQWSRRYESRARKAAGAILNTDALCGDLKMLAAFTIDDILRHVLWARSLLA